MADLEKLCSLVLSARKERDDIKKDLDALEKKVEEAEATLTKALADADGKISHGGFSFSTSAKVSFKMRKDGKDELIGILKKGAPELVKESVNAATLSSYLRKNEGSLDEEKPAWWKKAKPLVERVETQSLSVRKSTKKK